MNVFHQPPQEGGIFLSPLFFSAAMIRFTGTSAVWYYY
jgi:hypothetical protein